MSRFRTIVENAIAKINKKPLNERCESTFINVSDWENTYPIEVFENPSKSEFNKLLRKVGNVRGIADDKDVLVWNVSYVVHDMVLEGLHRAFGVNFPEEPNKLCRFQVTNNFPLMFEDNAIQYSHGKQLDILKQMLLKNPNFTRLFSKEEILNADSHNFANGEFGKFQNDPEILKKFGYD